MPLSPAPFSSDKDPPSFNQPQHPSVTQSLDGIIINARLFGNFYSQPLNFVPLVEPDKTGHPHLPALLGHEQDPNLDPQDETENDALPGREPPKHALVHLDFVVRLDERGRGVELIRQVGRYVLRVQVRVPKVVGLEEPQRECEDGLKGLGEDDLRLCIILDEVRLGRPKQLDRGGCGGDVGCCVVEQPGEGRDVLGKGYGRVRNQRGGGGEGRYCIVLWEGEQGGLEGVD